MIRGGNYEGGRIIVSVIAIAIAIAIAIVVIIQAIVIVVVMINIIGGRVQALRAGQRRRPARRGDLRGEGPQGSGVRRAGGASGDASYSLV